MISVSSDKRGDLTLIDARHATGYPAVHVLDHPGGRSAVPVYGFCASRTSKVAALVNSESSRSICACQTPEYSEITINGSAEVAAVAQLNCSVTIKHATLVAARRMISDAPVRQQSQSLQSFAGLQLPRRYTAAPPSPRGCLRRGRHAPTIVLLERRVDLPGEQRGDLVMLRRILEPVVMGHPIPADAADALPLKIGRFKSPILFSGSEARRR